LAVGETGTVGLTAFLTENLRCAIDVSLRGGVETIQSDVFSTIAIGIDLHKVFSSQNRDWGTLTLQAYLTRIDGLVKHPPFFDDNHDWELVYRIFTFNLTALTHGWLNVRVGHFEIPYGLEYLINTNGTLRDFMHPRNLGVKADWGVTINGDLPWPVEYEIGLSRGTGNEYFETGNPYAFSGRIGSSRDESIIVGISGFFGRVASPKGKDAKITRDRLSPGHVRRGIILRRRVGVDCLVYLDSVALMGEVSYGKDRDTVVVNSLFEIDWIPDEASEWQTYAQVRSFLERRPRTGTSSANWDDAHSLTLGVRYRPPLPRFTNSTTWAVSAQIAQAINEFGNARRGLVGMLQLRLRF
jgi:hypothetical protein